MKKKLGRISALFIITAAAIFLFAFFGAAAETEGDITYIIKPDSTAGDLACITEVSPDVSGEFVIPDTLGGYPVKAIEPKAFENCSGITGITLPDTLPPYSWSLFDPDNLAALNELNNLTTVTVSPQNIYFTSEDGILFSKNKGELIRYPAAKAGTEYVVPDGVIRIGAYAFFGCENITRMEIPDGVTAIGENAFNGCMLLTDISLPDTVTSIAANAFSGTGVYEDENNREDGILYIDNCLICADTGISGAVTIKPETVIIADCAFRDCGQLTKAVFGDSLTNIGQYAFAYCSALEEVCFANSDICIGREAFAYCSALNSLNFGSGNADIGGKAFAYCTSVESVTFGDGDINVSFEAFEYCDALSLVVFGNGSVYIDYHVFYSCDALTDVIFGDGYVRITCEGFRQCRGLKNVTFGDCDVRIDVESFDHSLSLANLTFGNGNVSIGAHAFGDCRYLKSVTFGDGDISIDNFAFCYCPVLSDVNFGGGNVSIGCEVFYESPSLTDITVLGRDGLFECGASDLPGITVHGYCGSAAKDFADKNNIPFVLLENSHADADNDAYCDICGEQIREKNFIEKIADFFRRIIEFFRNLFR